jgi:hypothetical protein
MRKEREETLKILKALKGPPNFGKSCVPKISVPDDMVMELIDRPPISQRVSNPHALRDILLFSALDMQKYLVSYRNLCCYVYVVHVCIFVGGCVCLHFSILW